MGQLAFERAGDPKKLRVKSRISQFLVDNDDKVIIYMCKWFTCHLKEQVTLRNSG